MRQAAGIIFSVMGFFLSAVSLNSLNAGGMMAGPMAIHWTPLLAIVLLPPGLAFVYSGTRLRHRPSSKAVLVLAIVSLIISMKNTWQYPPVDGAWYLLRYGREQGEKLSAPDAWQHTAAYAYTCLLFYLGTTHLLFQEYPLPVAQDNRALLLRTLPAIICAVLIYPAGELYKTFIEILVSGALSSTQQQTYLATIAILPAGLTVMSFALRSHIRLALVCLLSGIGFGLLLGITYWTYRGF